MKTLFLACLFALSFNSFSNDNHPLYYPSDIDQKIWSMNIKNHEMIKLLQKVLDSYHISKANKPDVIVDHCPSGKTCYKKYTLSYHQAKQYLFGQLHLEVDNHGFFVKEVYCNNIYDKNTPDIWAIGPMKVPNHQIVNCEHTWPKSRFRGEKGSAIYEEQKSDLHHLFPTQMEANSIRSSYRFGEVLNSTSYKLCSTSTLGVYQDHPDDKSFSNFFFEPPMEHRGNVARALFYFSVKYNLSISLDEEYYLRKWHVQDPVDEDEVRRNDEIYKIQNNRNPFIDYPFLIDLISDF